MFVVVRLNIYFSFAAGEVYRLYITKGNHVVHQSLPTHKDMLRGRSRIRRRHCETRTGDINSITEGISHPRLASQPAQYQSCKSLNYGKPSTLLPRDSTQRRSLSNHRLARHIAKVRHRNRMAFKGIQEFLEGVVLQPLTRQHTGMVVVKASAQTMRRPPCSAC